MRVRVLIVMLFSLTLGACATAPRHRGTNAITPSGQPSQPPQAQQNLPNPKSESHNPAVVALLGEANSAQSNGHLDASSEAVERAIDIEPENPKLWHRLASLYLDQGDAGQAAAMARKSNSLLGNNSDLRAKNWHIIAQALRMQGKSAAAARAEAKAQSDE